MGTERKTSATLDAFTFALKRTKCASRCGRSTALRRLKRIHDESRGRGGSQREEERRDKREEERGGRTDSATGRTEHFHPTLSRSHQRCATNNLHLRDRLCAKPTPAAVGGTGPLLPRPEAPHSSQNSTRILGGGHL